LLGLGAVVVGSVLRNGDRVVANTGDRVVVEGPRGYTVYKDDDALLRQPGATMRTETFADGSTRTTLDRVDGSQVVTIRDSRGRVLRRAAVYPDGTQYELFDDLEPSRQSMCASCRRRARFRAACRWQTAIWPPACGVARRNGLRCGPDVQPAPDPRDRAGAQPCSGD
jgi:hypothetical protein